MSIWERYIKDFVSYLKIERGLADNSILAYQNDVQKLSDYSIARQKTAINLNYNDLKDFVAVLYDMGLSARSQARIISGLKQFFGFLPQLYKEHWLYLKPFLNPDWYLKE